MNTKRLFPGPRDVLCIWWGDLSKGVSPIYQIFIT